MPLECYPLFSSCAYLCTEVLTDEGRARVRLRARPSAKLCWERLTRGGSSGLAGVRGVCGRGPGCQRCACLSLAAGHLACCPLFRVRGGVILYIRSLSSVYKSLPMIISLGKFLYVELLGQSV